MPDSYVQWMRHYRRPEKYVWNLHPRALQSRIRYAWAAFADLFSRESPDLPPPELRDAVGNSSYVATGNEFANIFVKYGGLTPTDRVLDVGCGSGRMALPLRRFLRGGSYEGFDVSRAGIEWCQRNITPHYPHFRFTQVDVQNPLYNPQGTCDPSSFQFPYPDKSFDFAFLASVFTHMLKPEVGHYLAELARVLRPGGKCLITWFLLSEESQRMMDEGGTYEPGGRRHFYTKLGDAFVQVPEKPEAAVGYREETALELLQQHGFEILAIHPGRWCGRPECLSYQDITVTERQG